MEDKNGTTMKKAVLLPSTVADKLWRTEELWLTPERHTMIWCWHWEDWYRGIARRDQDSTRLLAQSGRCLRRRIFTRFWMSCWRCTITSCSCCSSWKGVIKAGRSSSTQQGHFQSRICSLHTFWMRPPFEPFSSLKADYAPRWSRGACGDSSTTSEVKEMQAPERIIWRPYICVTDSKACVLKQCLRVLTRCTEHSFLKSLSTKTYSDSWRSCDFWSKQINVRKLADTT